MSVSFSYSLDDIYICLYLLFPCFEHILLVSSIKLQTDTHRSHQTHIHVQKVSTPIASYFYMQPNVSLWSDTWRMFAVHPLHVCTLPERKQLISTKRTPSFIRYFTRSLILILWISLSLSLHFSLHLIAYLLIAFL